jgi:predicted RNase H-like HicB family nuclease
MITEPLTPEEKKTRIKEALELVIAIVCIILIEQSVKIIIKLII